MRPLEIGVCGTAEISEGLFGVAPDGEDRLVLGHELLGRVERDADFARGDLVTATVRRSCGHCIPCAQGAPDSCDTGDYLERGITRLHRFAAELVLEAPEHLVPVPRRSGGSACWPSRVRLRARAAPRARDRRPPAVGPAARARHRHGGDRDARHLPPADGGARRLGRGPRSDEHKQRLVGACGSRFVATDDAALRDVADDVGGFDVVLEAAGDAQVMLDALALLRRNGVACLLGIDGRPRDVSSTGGCSASTRSSRTARSSAA